MPLLTQGTVDEMRPPEPISVPLWLALFFKKRDKCRLTPPDWLEPEALETTLTEERTNTGQFAEIPFHYSEVAKELLECAADDIPEVHRVRSLLKDIEDVRRGKVERGLRNFDQNTMSVKLTNLSAMELNRIRTVAAGALDEMRSFVPSSEQEQEEQQTTQSASQPASSAPDAQLQEALQRRAERRWDSTHVHSSAGARSTGAVVGGVRALSGETASPGCRLGALCRARMPGRVGSRPEARVRVSTP